MTTVREVYQMILDGNMKYDFHGHKLYDVEQRHKRSAQYWIVTDYANDKDFNSCKKFSNLSASELKCFSCGKRIIFSYKDGTLHADCVVEHVDDETIPFYERYKITDLSECSYAVAAPYVGKIKVISTLIFTNWFNHVDDSPEGEKYSDEYSLNFLSGRDNIARYKEKSNIAFGTLGNMCYYVLVHKDKNSILLVDTRERLRGKRFKDYEIFGESIQTPLWRWEATDKATLGEEGYKAHLEFAEERYMDIVEVDVSHGEWMYEHFYDRFEHNYNSPIILARWTLKQ